MSFFGITALGVEDPFAASKGATVEIFSEADIKRAFNAIKGDDEKALVAEIPQMMEILYHGPCPKGEVEFLSKFFDQNNDGFVEWFEIQESIDQLKKHLEECRKQKKTAKAVPAEKYANPLTTSQVLGWPNGEKGEMNDKAFPKKSCEETKFAAAMLQSGFVF
eukprot:TRINITY_DN6570_c0_g1_i1.p1 TRINITY_DN6570_c0_g1~~TRINITY_DN6570_c0_g1_i1.p1  ORF type:complete len:163 (+),score=45.72 TRINITY_DN6570_c0_g1_i1:39-527(+)